jgi:hypothetical protein
MYSIFGASEQHPIREQCNMSNDMTDWLEKLYQLGHPYLPLAASLSLLTFIASLLLLPALCLMLPSDHFIAPSTTRQPSLSNTCFWLLRNTVALALLLLGILLLALPGQGLLTILFAIVMADFPGKQKLEQTLIRRRTIFQSANRIRKHYHRPPFIHPDEKFDRSINDS